MLKRKWYCDNCGIHYEEEVEEKPMTRSDTCPECAVKREEAQWLKI